MKEKILFFLHLIITVGASIMYVITMKQKAAAIREYNSLSQWQRSTMSVYPYNNPDYTVYFLTVAIVSFICFIMFLIIMIKEKKDKKNRSAE